MKVAHIFLFLVGASCAACTGDSREEASLEQIVAAIDHCGVAEWEITESLEDVTTALVVNFGSGTDASQRACFKQQMQAQDVVQTTSWWRSTDVGAQ